jgi:Phospholipase_D-nuclease N-terminal
LLAVLVVLALANIALMVGALVSVVSRPDAGVRFGRKWLWIVLIVLVNWIGPLAWFALGRVDVPLPHDPGADDAPAAERAARAVELLYGPREQR